MVTSNGDEPLLEANHKGFDMRAHGTFGALIFIPLLILIPTAARASLEPATIALDNAPESEGANVVLMFATGVNLAASTIEVIDSEKHQIQIDAPELGENGMDVNIQLHGPLPPGIYTIRWRAFSTDGRLSQGNSTFDIEP
ncbi:copper resistance CopC family protein [Rhizobium tubonense]|uniref:CopC domain-containing protein n=1 Tax=Rhizobium tubonense TaxID=484088 RepID=A0A2W4C4I4_9HYPH|nr:copper resistance protein CopC [Rhizobium tubonense]PZM07981.1 hypothetical protein CPY51_29965 [Rhizobium tubonense]